MNIPANNNPAWLELVTGRKKVVFQFLGTRILVGRLVLECRLDESDEKKKKCIEELISFFRKNIHIPQAQEDLKSIFGGMLS